MARNSSEDLSRQAQQMCHECDPESRAEDEAYLSDSPEALAMFRSPLTRRSLVLIIDDLRKAREGK